MSKENSYSQEDFVRSWFIKNAGRDIPHTESKPLIEGEWLTLNGTRIEDADRAIRKLAAQGELIKVSKGVYRYAELGAEALEMKGFSEFTKQAVLERDAFRCVTCGQVGGVRVGLHVVPKKRFEAGGFGTLSNGQTLCSFHKLATDLLDSKGLLAKAEARRILDAIKVGGKIVLADDKAFALAFLSLIEDHAVSGQVNWKALAD